MDNSRKKVRAFLLRRIRERKVAPAVSSAIREVRDMRVGFEDRDS